MGRGKVGSGNKSRSGVAAAADSGGAFCVNFTERSQYSTKIAIATAVVQGRDISLSSSRAGIRTLSDSGPWSLHHSENRGLQSRL